MRRKKQEHLVATVTIKGKGKEKMLDGLSKWLKEATRYRDIWKVMVAYAKEHDT